MRKTVLILLADGFEEVESVTPVDVLRRAGVEVIVAGVGKTEIKGSRGLRVLADIRLEDYQGLPDAIVLPGGIPGAENLRDSAAVKALVKKMHDAGRLIGAICAAPGLVLAGQGILDGKKATGYPGYEKEFKASTVYQEKSVVKDGQLLTSRGPGTAMEFSLELAKLLAGEATAEKVASAMLTKTS